jgi:Nitrate and nitrite sensing
MRLTSGDKTEKSPFVRLLKHTSWLIRRDWALEVLCVVVIAAIVLGGMRIAVFSGSAVSDEHVAQLAILAGAVTELAAGIQDEQDDLAVYVAQGRPDSASALLVAQGQEAVTNLEASHVSALARDIGTGFGRPVRSALTAVLRTSRGLPAIRQDAISGQAAALAVINRYARATSGLNEFDGQLTTDQRDPAIASEARALGALSRAEDDAAQERSILDAALTAGTLRPGESQALSAAQSAERAELASFDSSATLAERRSYAAAMTGSMVGSAARILSEAVGSGPDLVSVANPPGSAFITAAQSWKNDMMFTVDQMRGAEQGLLSAIEQRGQALHAQAVRAALETWIGLAAAVVAAAGVGAVLIHRRRFSWPYKFPPQSWVQDSQNTSPA